MGCSLFLNPRAEVDPLVAAVRVDATAYIDASVHIGAIQWPNAPQQLMTSAEFNVNLQHDPQKTSYFSGLKHLVVVGTRYAKPLVSADDGWQTQT